MQSGIRAKFTLSVKEIIDVFGEPAEVYNVLPVIEAKFFDDFDDLVRRVAVQALKMTCRRNILQVTVGMVMIGSDYTRWQGVNRSFTPDGNEVTANRMLK